MIDTLKKYLYFPLASYFRFFAAIKLRRWNPRVIVVTGSNGKTTLLHMLESQIGDHAKYSHHANTSFGIPFDILGIHRKTSFFGEWLLFFLLAPLFAFTQTPKEKLYVVESDVYRAGVGKFISSLLQPEVVLWVSTSATHSMNFDQVMKQGKFKHIEDAIAYDYGYFVASAQKLAVINGDSSLQVEQIKRATAQVKAITQKKYLDEYRLDKKGTQFAIEKKKYSFDALLPKEVFYAIAMCKETVDYLQLPFDTTFARFVLPPGRGTVFSGIKGTTLIDSTYNGNLSSIQTVLAMYQQMKTKKKWVVIGDMLELGEEEKEQHEKLAETLSSMDVERVVLVGPRTAKYTYPKLMEKLARHNKISISSFTTQKEAKEDLRATIQGEETILFKASQSLFLEGLIEPLLSRKSDVSKLPRRDKFWDDQRSKLGI